MKNIKTALTVPVVAAAAVLGGIAGAPIASASTTAVAAASVCGMKPTTNSGNPAGWIGTGVNIRTGPSTGCPPIGEGEPGDSTYAHCWFTNSSTPYVWVYLTDYTRGKEGWAAEQYLSWSGTLAQCN